MDTLEGKKVLITGASRGIGAAAARLCVEKGARVVAHASQLSPAADAVRDVVMPAGGNMALEDLAEPGAGARLVACAVDAVGGLDVVVNNAGVYLPTPLDGPDAEWDVGWAATLSINVKAPADICRAAVAHFRQKGGGRIINIASHAAKSGFPHAQAYTSSKHGLVGLARSAAVE
ncbi:MAG: SDR family NAD(P)-dependent oxidoreductase, partial [Pseudomonadota bacterium]